jgi:hypothetical protein
MRPTTTRALPPPVVCRAFGRDGAVMAVVLADSYAVRVGGVLLPERYRDRGEVVAAVIRVARGGDPGPPAPGCAPPRVGAAAG